MESIDDVYKRVSEEIRVYAEIIKEEPVMTEVFCALNEVRRGYGLPPMDINTRESKEIYGSTKFCTPKPKWISVKDRLPILGTMNIWYYQDEFLIGLYDGIGRFGFTHWMPLPNPPESND